MQTGEGTLCPFPRRRSDSVVAPGGSCSAKTYQTVTMMQPDTPVPNADLILIGASARAAAASAARAGLTAIAVGLFGDSDARELVEKWFSAADLLDHLQKTNELPVRLPDSIPVLQVGDFDGCEELVNSIRPHAAGDSLTFLRGRRYLEWLHHLAKSCGLPMPESRFNPPSENPGWLQKRFRSSGGLGVSWADSRSQDPDGHFWQRWHPGKPYGASFIGDGNDVMLIGVCRSHIKRFPGRPFVYKGSTGPVSLPEPLVEKLVNLACRITQETNLEGLFNVDILFDGQNVSVLEINPRWSSSMELHDRALARQLDCGTASLIGDAIRLANQQCGLESLAGKYRKSDHNPVLFDKRVVYAQVSGRVDTKKLKMAIGHDFEIADIPADGERIMKHTPIATLISTCDRPHRRRWIFNRRSKIQVVRDSVTPEVD